MDFFRQHLASCSNLNVSNRFSGVANSSSIAGHGLQHISNTTPAENLSEELWQACAGSLAYVPRVGERVWYFPQGHMEQVSASTQQDSCQHLAISDRLSSQILCVVLARDLSAETDTDEVYAKISLAPEPQQSLDASVETDSREGPISQAQPKSSTRLFVKILTASDTSTHGGFSVLRKHAEECLPPLDMNQETPTQELKARDLHGYEWKFRHTYRGHPRRHLLTTGWSLFVSQKKLLAGDAVIFLRGKDGELRVGIRRAKRPQSAPQAVMSRESMHMGVIATALHALNTRTMFSVFFKPRLSTSSFLVPTEKFKKAISVSLSVGMRLRMQCETDTGSDMSLTGTVTGIDAVNPENWRDSKWRSLKVDWDEGNHEYPSRVSPWEIEPATSLVMNSSSSSLRTKRPRLSSLGFASVADFPLPGFDEGFLDRTHSFEMQNVLQGQESLDLRTSLLWQNPNHKHSSNHAVQMQYQLQQEMGMDAMFCKKSLFPRTDLECKASASSIVHDAACYLQVTPTCDSSLTKFSSSSLPSQQNSQLVSKYNSSTTTTPLRALNPVFHPSTDPNIPSQVSPILPKKDHCDPFRAVDPRSAQLPAASETEVKLFGISLTVTPTEKRAEKRDLLLSMERGKVPAKVPDLQTLEMENVDNVFDRGRSECIEAEIRCKQSTRSCIKVIKKGSIVGRGVDLSKYEGYDSLLEGLEAMFDMKGDLTDPGKGWQVAYSDREGDTMKVGDDPWPEFCCMVKKLHIISQEEKKEAC